MLLALFIVALLIYVIARSQRQQLQKIDTRRLPEAFNKVLTFAIAFTLLQVAMGTQVREGVDMIANQHGYIDRQYWRDDFPVVFYIHRSFSSVILFTNLWLAWKLYRSTDRGGLLFQFGFILGGLVAAAILAGVSLDRLGFPAIAQPIHLLLANMIFGAQFFIFLVHNGIKD